MEKAKAEVAAALIWDGDRFLICQRPAHKARGQLFGRLLLQWLYTNFYAHPKIGETINLLGRRDIESWTL